MFAVVLAAGAVLSGCTVVGVVTGGVIGGVLGGPDGAAAGAELGMYMGMGADAAILEALSHPSDEYDDEGHYEWYADGYDEDDCDEGGPHNVRTEHAGVP